MQHVNMSTICGKQNITCQAKLFLRTALTTVHRMHRNTINRNPSTDHLSAERGDAHTQTHHHQLATVTMN